MVHNFIDHYIFIQFFGDLFVNYAFLINLVFSGLISMRCIHAQLDFAYL